MICIDMSNYMDLTNQAAQCNSLERQLAEATEEVHKKRRENYRLRRRLSWVRRAVEDVTCV